MELESPTYYSSHHKTALTTLATSPRMPSPVPKAQDPQILHNPKYKLLHQKIHKDKLRTSKYDEEIQAEKLREKVKHSIYDYLHKQEVQKKFLNKFSQFAETSDELILSNQAIKEHQPNRKYSINTKNLKSKPQAPQSYSLNTKKSIRHTNKNIEPYTIFLRNQGRTEMIKNEQQMHLYLADLKNTEYFQVECRLRKYYLDIISKQKNKVQYLQQLEKTSHHRRLFSKQREIQKFYTQTMGKPMTAEKPEDTVKIDLERQYKSNKKSTFITKDQLSEFAGRRAMQNVTYRKKKNYQLIDYIMQVSFKNLQHQMQYQEDSLRQSIFNKKVKFFLNLAYCCQPIRIYYDFISEQNFKRLYQLITQANHSVKEKQLKSFVSIIVENKKKPLLRFQDFNQFLQRINQQYNCDILSLLEGCNPQIFDNYSRLSEQEQVKRRQIRKKAQQQRMKIMISRAIFDQKADKIILNRFLPIKSIIEALKSQEIVPKIVSQQRIIYCLMENLKRREGLSIEEVLESLINYATKIQNWISVLNSVKQLMLPQRLISR